MDIKPLSLKKDTDIDNDVIINSSSHYVILAKDLCKGDDLNLESEARIIEIGEVNKINSQDECT